MKLGKILLFVCLSAPQVIHGMVKTLSSHNHFQQQPEVQLRANSMPCVFKHAALVAAIQEFVRRAQQFFSPTQRVRSSSGEELSRKHIYIAKLFNAVKLGQQRVAQELLQKVSVNSRDGYGNTPFMWAVYRNDTEMVKLLLRYRDLDINVANDYGHTALMWATWYANLNVVLLLLQQPGLMTQKKDCIGHTALDWACEAKGMRKKVVQLLFKRDQIVVDHYYQEWRIAHVRKKAAV